MYLIRISRIKKTFRKGNSVTLSYSYVYIYKAYSKCTVAGIKQLEPLSYEDRDDDVPPVLVIHCNAKSKIAFIENIQR